MRDRFRRVAASVVAIAFIVLLASAPVAGQLFRLREQTFEHDGMTRRYLVYTPARARSLQGKRPLVLVLHGGGGTHRGMPGLTGRGFHSLADRDGFYVVYPNAVDKSWDFGEGAVSSKHKVRVDDLGFFRELLTRLQGDYPIDPKRMFATGISRGGQASYFLACKFPGVFRAIAPLTMPLPTFLKDDCSQGPATGIAILNGTADPLVPYDGGHIALFGIKREEILSTEETIELWKLRNGCSGPGSTLMLPDRADDEILVEKTSWSACEGAAVVLYKIAGGGHTWPSGKQYLPVGLVGPVARDIDGAAEIWSFFKSFD